MRDDDDDTEDDGGVGVGGMAKKGQGATESDDAWSLPIPDQERVIHSSRKRRKKTRMRKRTRPEKRSDRPMMHERSPLSSSPSSSLEVVQGSKGENEDDVVTWARLCWRWSGGWWSSPRLWWRYPDFWGERDRLACATARDVEGDGGGEGLVLQSSAGRVRLLGVGDTCAFGGLVPVGRAVGEIGRARVQEAGAGERIGGVRVAEAVAGEGEAGSDPGCYRLGPCCEPALFIYYF